MTTATATSTRIFNFAPGPAVLPEQCLKQAQQDIWNIADSGIGVLEHSHRGSVIKKVFEEAEADCRKVANISDDYAVIFQQGGSTLQFAMCPMNFLTPDKTADYLHTGAWSKKAIREAKLFGNVHLAYDGTGDNFDHIPGPDEINYSANPEYVYYCDNNTIFGTEWSAPPQTDHLLVADMCSNMFSRPIDINRHAVLFASGQKNLGPSGGTLVIIRKDFLEKANADLPVMLDYQTQVDKGSMLNTPPVFAVYFMGLVFKWILANGGLKGMAKRNDEKAKLIYDAIDGSDFYQAVARPDSRSRMNVTFRTPNEDLDAKFVAEALENDLSGLKGHRSVGGLRASLYNALPMDGAKALAQFMADFAQKNG
ncbi:MAG: 3-phosphoserine/phosphohydroxythreonine transaminase [Phycisphaerales bacterium]|nr:MAG: 3-phosphoserine/phosphohydroxythreonine transaminase [Phycisphaerales bacterium]